MLDSTFDVFSLDRKVIKWEEHLYDFSPVEKVGDIYFKREDKFAPLGYGNINGTKLRQCIWLIDRYVKNAKHPEGVVQGAVTGSPQHPMVATICKHFGLKSLHVIGTSDIDHHKNLVLARNMGADFFVSNIGYARNLEKIAYALKAEKYPNYFVLETNITLNEDRNPPRDLAAFHSVAATQIKNIPEHIETIMLPAGSCNSITSVLMGLATYKPKNIKNIVIFGIGSWGSKDPDYIRRRLNVIKSVNPSLDLDMFNFNFNNEGLPFTFEDNQCTIDYHNLNGEGYCEYNDLMPYKHGSIELHPRYEGKCFNYMKDNPKKFDKYMNDKTMFWIVGSEPQINV